MKKKHIELLTYLCEHDYPVTSKELAHYLGISSRSVKNYVNELNLLSTHKVIFSSQAGYTVEKKSADKLQNEKLSFPETSEERANYIIKQLLIEHTSHLNLYDLCDILYVGYSTLKSDIAKMNKSLSGFGVQFVCKNDSVKILGEEKNIRKLMSYIIYEETNTSFIDTTIIKKSFKSIQTDKIADIIKNTFHKYNYYINDLSFINLLLHFAIIIDRIKDGNYMDNSKENFSIENKIESDLVLDLCSLLKECSISHLIKMSNLKFICCLRPMLIILFLPIKKP